MQRLKPAGPVPAPGAMWMGGSGGGEQRRLYHRARLAGMSHLRAYVVAQLASWRDAWFFRSTIAEFCRCSIRTVQRALTQAKSLGLIGVHRAKQGEIPPGGAGPLPCGWSHRFVVGWGLATAAVRKAVTAARVLYLFNQTKRQAERERRAELERRAGAELVDDAVRTAARRGKWTEAELDAELERRARDRL